MSNLIKKINAQRNLDDLAEFVYKNIKEIQFLKTGKENLYHWIQVHFELHACETDAEKMICKRMVSRYEKVDAKFRKMKKPFNFSKLVKAAHKGMSRYKLDEALLLKAGRLAKKEFDKCKTSKEYNSVFCRIPGMYLVAPSVKTIRNKWKEIYFKEFELSETVNMIVETFPPLSIEKDHLIVRNDKMIDLCKTGEDFLTVQQIFRDNKELLKKLFDKFQSIPTEDMKGYYGIRNNWIVNMYVEAHIAIGDYCDFTNNMERAMFGHVT